MASVSRKHLWNCLNISTMHRHRKSASRSAMSALPWAKKMSMFQKMYKQKAKRVRDPNLPPPPNLLAHDKTIRGMAGDIEHTQSTMQQQSEEIRLLKSKLNQALYRIDLLTSYLRTNR